jgi:programmed cell death protein 5
MEDDELEALRQKRLLELQAQAHAEEAGYDRAEEEHIRAQREALLRQLFTPEARSRLANIRLAKPEFATNVEDQMIILAQAGRVPIPITDELLKSVLGQIQGHKREITIKRV